MFRILLLGVLALWSGTAWGQFADKREVPLFYNGTDYVPAKVDSSTRTLQTMEYEHHEVHGGSHFFTKNVATVASGATVAYLMAIPSGTKEVHLIWSGTGSAITDVRLVEDCPSTLSGTTQTIFNNHRNSSTKSGVTFYNTVTGGPFTGTTLYVVKSGAATQQSRTPASSERNYELIMKSGATYYFLFTSSSDNNLTNLICEWYEHTPKN